MKISAILALFTATLAVDAVILTHEQATQRLKAGGVTWSSTGNCSDRTNADCTSFQGVRSESIDSAVSLKKQCKCTLHITGGTETGHSKTGKSHEKGYKLDFRIDKGPGTFIKSTMKEIAKRGNYRQWQSSAGNIYCEELRAKGPHWDVTFV